MNIMAWRHISIAIFRKFVSDRAVQKIVDEDDEKDGEEDEFFDLQAGHGSKIAGMIYGRQLNESPFHTVNKRVGFRKVSESWHRFLLFQSSLSTISQNQKAPDRWRGKQ